MQRLFTVGCSLTRYHWPTWADILGQSFDNFENWGNRGAGNRQILERFSELVVKNDFTEDDVVVVQWTNYHRFDQHQWDNTITESWYPAGNVFQEANRSDIRSVIIKKMWYEETYIMHTWNSIHAALGIANTIPAKVLFVFGQDLRLDLNNTTFSPYKKLLSNDSFVDGDIFGWVCNNNDNRMSFYNADPNTHSRDKQFDHHPTPIMYYEWLNNFIAPRLGIEIDKEFAVKIQSALESVTDYNKIGDAIENVDYSTNTNGQRGY